MDAYGWCVVRVSREPYRNIDSDSPAIDELDERIGEADEALAIELEAWLNENGQPCAAFSWSIHRKVWTEQRVITFTSSRNHRSSRVWDLFEWLAGKGSGSYGLMYVHDDEDLIDNRRYGRGNADHSNEFRVFRLLHGEIAEFDDPFLSPIFPTINPSQYCS